MKDYGKAIFWLFWILFVFGGVWVGFGLILEAARHENARSVPVYECDCKDLKHD